MTYGAGDYERYIPNTGFINVFNFTEIKELAEYLKYLNDNKVAYNSFFKWKQYLKYNLNGTKNGHFCEMCIQLNLEHYLGLKKQVITDLKALWGDEKNCFENIL